MLKVAEICFKYYPIASFLLAKTHRSAFANTAYSEEAYYWQHAAFAYFTIEQSTLLNKLW